MRFATPDGPRDIAIQSTYVAGWTGRDAAAVEHHIEELAAIGVAPPSEVPLYYRVSGSLLTQSETIEVLGPDTSGEVEPLIIREGGRLWLGLASDHTDRALETVSVAASKQICAKPVSREVWPLEDVADHLDQLILTCDIEDRGEWRQYQNGTLANIRPLPELIDGSGMQENAAMLCGKLAAIGGVRPASSYRMSLVDPIRQQTLSLTYCVLPLTIVS